MKKEKERQEQYRKPVSVLTNNDQESRREKNRKYAQRYRDKQTLKKNMSVHISVEDPGSPVSNIISVSRATRKSSEPLLVKLNFENKHRSKLSRRARQKIENLNDSIQQLKKNEAK